ncbi:MAG TPA: hypothetical protein VGG70_00290 [Candidatus Cybelea sp.]|jgi:hypothetical protein
MRFYSRGFLILSLALGLAACGGAAQDPTPAIGAAESGTQPSIDAILESAPAVSGGHEVFRKMRARPDAGAPALLMNFVANGPAQGGVPCFDCVNGASTGDNVGLTGPSNYVLSGDYWQYAISFTDVTYKGKCKVSWAITSEKKTIDSFSASFNITTAGGFVVYALNRARPKYSGPATLTGKYVCGKYSDSTKAPLYFQ